MDYELLGNRIRDRRRSLNLTQEALGNKVNISNSMIGHIERGTRVPSLETIVHICEALEVSLTAIVPTEKTAVACESRLNDTTERAKALLKMAIDLSTLR